MPGPAPRAQIVRGRSDRSRWELATRSPIPLLRPYLRRYTGYAEESPAPCRRAEFPTPQVTVILEFGPPIRVWNRAGRRHASTYPGGFVAGLDDAVAITEHDGFQRGIEVKLTPIGARLFFGAPMQELTGRVVPFDDVVPRDPRRLAQRLAELPDWDARFDLFEGLLARRIAEARVEVRAVAWAVRRIEACGGALDVGSLAKELGYSRKHVITLFRDVVGVPPKLLARLVRFERLWRRVGSGPPRPWADLASELGYYDQAHLIREVRHFTGTTPTKARAMLDDLARAGLASEVNFVQDGADAAP